MKKLFRSFLLVIFLAVALAALTLAVFSQLRRHILCVHPRCSSQTVLPTCSDVGYTLYTCELCKYEYKDDFTEPLGHTMKEERVEPTCDAEGYTLFFCECGYSYRGNTLPPLCHELESKRTDADCTSPGVTEYACKRCDYAYVVEHTPPLGHSFSASVVRPTATSAGYTQYLCDCEYSYRGDYVYYSDILESAYTENSKILARGIDVSRWNHQIDAASGEYLALDWDAVREAGFDFVILKAGSTKSGIEPTFMMDYEGARAAGLEVGAYFYTYSPTLEGIEKDARDLLSYIKGKKFEYPIYLDLEDPSLSSLGKNHLSALCERFLCILQQNGYYAGLYTNHTWLMTILDTPRMVTLFDLWYARYPLSEKPTWNEEKYGRQLGMWQYTESGRIDGLEGSFDLNYAYKDYKEVMQKWGLNGYQSQN